MSKAVKLALMLTTIATVAGCQTAPQPLYQWESYQPQVYEYFKGEPKEAQVEALERDLQKINASGRKAPPGYHAHLGMLYMTMGKDFYMVQEFSTEKALFPESASYMDFLLKNAKTGVATK